MHCEQFEQILLEQDFDALPNPALAHLETCEACRTLSSDFGAMHDMALELGAEGIAPPERVWITLRNQLESEGLIHDDRAPAHSATPASPGWWSAFQRPAIAGAFLGLTLVAAGTVCYLSNFTQAVAQSQLQSAPEQEPSTILSADGVFKEEVLTVSGDSIAGVQRQDTAVTVSIRKNLQVVDNFIALCEKSVQEQPDNQIAREYLYGAYEQKAELLSTAMNHNVTGGLQ